MMCGSGGLHLSRRDLQLLTFRGSFPTESYIVLIYNFNIILMAAQHSNFWIKIFGPIMFSLEQDFLWGHLEMFWLFMTGGYSGTEPTQRYFLRGQHLTYGWALPQLSSYK
jgi:hypothetical protein